MAAVILGWNPDRWNSWNYDSAIETIALTGQFHERWSVGRHRNIDPGADAWLLLQGSGPHGRGLIGHGTVTSATYEAPHYSDPGASLQYVSVVLDALLPLGSQIPLDVLASALSGLSQGRFRESGRAIAPEEEDAVRRLWQELGPRPEDPDTLTPGTYPEGAVTRVEVNRYERSPEARRVCLAYYGTSCKACGFSFEARYGAVAKDFIHVHHIVPVSQLGRDYQLDPINDLIPLCANCHTVAHLGVTAPRSVQELKALIAGAGHLAGSTVSQKELAAQRDSKWILDQQ